MITAFFLCLVAPGCTDQQPTAPTSKISRISRAQVPFNRFFVAWSQEYSSGPIETQVFALDARQERQYANWWPDESVLSFARANPGRLYIVGDEPDQYCVSPEEYAGTYRDFVATVRLVDKTARFSPAGVAEPNDHCCPQEPAPPDLECRERSHSLGYMDRFYYAYLQRYGSPPPVDEWRFHYFGIFLPVGDVGAWWAKIDRMAAWSVAHGATMVLGAWGFNAWDEPLPAVKEHMKQAMGLLLNDTRIVQAAYWSHKPWVHSRWYLMNDDGSLTAAGQTHVNPLTDVPTNVTISGFAIGNAQVQWSNTTSAWGADVEFWVQPAGSSTFVYDHTERVASLGASQTPVVNFKIGDSVKGRVRYYNVYGQAQWSAFSNTVSMGLLGPGLDKGKSLGKRSPYCLLSICS